MIRKILSIFPFLLAIVVSIVLWEQLKSYRNPFADKTEIDHNIILQKITAMGKLELVKYRFKDIIESKISKHFLPDAKIMLIVEGEAVGGIDLTKLKINQININNKVLKIYLPAPELSYYKVDHAKSKIYDTKFALLDEAILVDKAFKEAEQKIKKTALENGILEQTKLNTTKILTPLLEQIAGKKIEIYFP